jgi:hypothetical protein
MEIFNCEPIKKSKFRNKHHLAPQWPFRFLLCGHTGCGKTNVLINLIKFYLDFDRIYLYAKDLSEDKYEDLEKYFDEIKESHKKKLIKEKKKIEKSLISRELRSLEKVDSEIKPEEEDLINKISFFGSSLNEIADLDSLDKSYQNLVVFDDFVTEKDQDLIIDYFIRGRKKNCSIIYISQSYFKTPKDIRLQCDYFAIFEINSDREVSEICRDHCGSLDKDEFKYYFNMATKDPYCFLLIDKKTKTEDLTLRKCFGKV